jgi:hypothetical protein
MRRLLIAVIALAALVQAAAASAGCWATVGLAPPPAGVEPGQTWTARMTVLQHGQTPLPNAATARPTLTIVNDASGERQTFTARRTKDPTVFQAAVVFPSAGSWRYEVFDDFTSWEGEPAPCAQTHAFAAVAVGGGPSSPTPAPAEPVPAASSDGFPVWPVATGSLLAALAAAAMGAGFARRRRAAAAR